MHKMSSGKKVVNNDLLCGPAQQKNLLGNLILITRILATIQRLGVATACPKTKINRAG